VWTVKKHFPLLYYINTLFKSIIKHTLRGLIDDHS